VKRPSRVRMVVTALAVVAGTLVASPATAAPAIQPTRLPYPAGGTNSIGPGIAEGNASAQLAEKLPAGIKASWSAAPELCPSAGGVTPSSVAVAGSRTVVLEEQYQCASVSTYDTKTGALTWRKQYHFATTAKLTGGMVYVSHDNPTDGSWSVDALDVATGAVRWTEPIIGSKIDSIGSGVLVMDTLMLNLKTGSRTPALQIPAGTSGGKSLVADGRVFRNSGTELSAWSVSTGKRLWSYTKVGTSASGDALPSLHNGRLYVRSDSSGSTVKVFDPATGKVIRQLPASTDPLAFDGDYGFFTQANQNAQTFVTAVNLTTGVKVWTRTLPVRGGSWVPWGSTGPIVANGNVWLLHAPNTGTPAHLTAFNETTGATASSTTMPCEPGVGGALTIAQQRLFVSTSCGIHTYVAK